MRKDYKEIFPTLWVNYKYLDNSFVGQYFKAGNKKERTSKKNLQISVFAIYLKN